MQGVLAEIFRECGWHVKTASDGFEALQAIQEEAPDLLLSDLQMDGMSGFELLSVVRQRFPSVRVIAMSGSISGSTVPIGLAADAFYAKGDSSVATLLQQVAELPSVEELTCRKTRCGRMGASTSGRILQSSDIGSSLPPLLACRLLHAGDQ